MSNTDPQAEDHGYKQQKPGVRVLPQYITDQMILAINNVRARRMSRSDMDFETCGIKVYRVGENVRVDIQEKNGDQ